LALLFDSLWSQVYCYALDKENGTYFEFEKQLPLGTEITEYTPSSIQGTSKWTDGRQILEFSWSDEGKGWRVTVDVKVNSLSLLGKARRETSLFFGHRDAYSLVCIFFSSFIFHNHS
jgi:hypothetical protein